MSLDENDNRLVRLRLKPGPVAPVTQAIVMKPKKKKAPPKKKKAAGKKTSKPKPSTLQPPSDHSMDSKAPAPAKKKKHHVPASAAVEKHSVPAEPQGPRLIPKPVVVGETPAAKMVASDPGVGRNQPFGRVAPTYTRARDDPSQATIGHVAAVLTNSGDLRRYEHVYPSVQAWNTVQQGYVQISGLG